MMIIQQQQLVTFGEIATLLPLAAGQAREFLLQIVQRSTQGGEDRQGSEGRAKQIKELHWLRPSGGGFLKIIPIGILTYASVKTGFHADVSPKNQFSCPHRSECRLESSLKTRRRLRGPAIHECMQMSLAGEIVLGWPLRYVWTDERERERVWTRLVLGSPAKIM